jgi:hypothetical protein
MPTFRLLDGPQAGATVEAANPPVGYVVVAPEDPTRLEPRGARWITEEQRDRYLQLGAALVESLIAEGQSPEPYVQCLNFYRAMSSPEPAFGYFDDLDRFALTGRIFPD